MSKQKITLSLAADAVEILEGATTERRRGEFVAELLRNWQAAQSNTIDDDAGVLERIERKIDKLPGQLAALVG